MAAANPSSDPQFLAASDALEEERPFHASDCGETAMDRLRHPFVAVPPADPRNAVPVTSE